ncbi:hypothetical protein NS355_16275 [Sphingomonas yabuuchiae]|uniref:Uncharacterized protein n=1 Tax=Sphingomonas yabuuchiae TaxID=172044 RepID=A0A147IKQ0_9SPHN|nr:hypothetical protein NS355_16275 [Sphingomonas yabuuchiae]
MRRQSRQTAKCPDMDSPADSAMRDDRYMKSTIGMGIGRPAAAAFPLARSRLADGRRPNLDIMAMPFVATMDRRQHG